MTLNAEQAGEGKVRVDELTAVLGIAQSLVDTDDLALDLLGLLVAALLL